MMQIISLRRDSQCQRERAVRGGLWLGAGGGLEQGLRLFRNMLLARVLAPEAFGLMATIVAINAALESFTQVGIREAVIQDPDSAKETYLNGAWWLSFGRSLGLFAFGMVGSIWLVGFFQIPHDLRILQLSFLGILFNGALSARAYIALKQMDYKRWAVITHGGGICGIAASLLMALFMPNVLALVTGLVVESAARCVLSYALCPYLPRLRFDKSHAKRLLAYAGGMFGLPILYVIYAQVPVFLIGKIFSQREVGMYSMASSLAQAPTAMITVLVNQLLMPAFSSRQGDHAWLNAVLLKTTKLMVAVGFPVACFGALYARDLLTVVYGSPYVAAAGSFGLLFFAALLGACSIPMVNVYLAIGRPGLHRLFSGIRALSLVLVIYPATVWYGTTGTAVAVVASMALSFCFQVNRMGGLTRLDTRRYAKILLLGAGAAALVPVVWYATSRGAGPPSLGNLVSGAVWCAAAYGILGAVCLRKDIMKKYAARSASAAP